MFKHTFAARKLIFWSTLFATQFTPKVMASSQCHNDTYSVVFVTVPNTEVAKKISHGLVLNKMAACVNIIPGVTSIYMWKGEVNEDSELILKIKTRTSAINALTEFVKKNHPYDVCEVISVPITNGNPEYLSWISDIVPKELTKPQSKTDELK